ncbi:protein-tyrosine phosphatase family protein [Natronorubrum sp. FCH18a]|uniref:protein-tyrosine phosphatase family protein n=1 Tax=Natronorubrum sp. FCH18a TaxID=3447018 RepID=UPI003F51AB1D
MTTANFGRIVADGPLFGACRPGHLGGSLAEWTEILTDHDVSAVVCLLSEREASCWGLPGEYDETFDTAHVPIRDRHLPDVDRLRNGVDFLEETTADGGRVAIHCNAGLGRTGVVAAGWLVRERGCTPESAAEAVETRPWPRAPREAIRDGNATESELYELLERV